MTERLQGCFRRTKTGLKTGTEADGRDDTGLRVARDHHTRPFATPGQQGSRTSTGSFNPETALTGGLDRRIIRAGCLDSGAIPTVDEQAGCVWHAGAGNDGMTGLLHICLLSADGNDQAARLLAEDPGARALDALGQEAQCVWRLGNGSDGMARQFQKSLLQANIDRKADGN